MRVAVSYIEKKGCVMQLVFESVVDAIHHFKTLFAISGRQSFSVVFTVSERLKLSFVPFFGGAGITLSDIVYSKLELDAFFKNTTCLHQFQVYFGIVENNEFVEVEFEAERYLVVNGYSCG